MSTGLTHGLPVVLLVLIVVIYLRSGKQPAPYRLSEKWTHPPVLWSAAEVTLPADTAPAGQPSVGGGASGQW